MAALFAVSCTDDETNSDYRFSGKFLDEETGFYDFGQRFYDPKIGLWLSVDLLFTDTPGEAVGRALVLSLYGYANHSPMRFVDPDGIVQYKHMVWEKEVRSAQPALPEQINLLRN